MLAREQKAPLATLRTLHDEYRANARSPLVLVHLGLALQLMGDQARAKVALDDAMRLGYGLGGSTQEYGDWLGDYGSRVRDYAMAYGLLHRFKISHARRENLLLDLRDDFDKRRYFSTQERWALFLAARAAGAGGDQAWQTKVQIAGKTEVLTGNASQQRAIDVADFKRGLSLMNQGDSTLFIEVAVEGYPIKPLPARNDLINIERSWWTPKGEAITGRQFKTGDMLVVRLRVSSNQSIKDGLIVDRIPAGMEIENLNLSQGVQASEFNVNGVNVGHAMANQRIKHFEFRDDRFVAAAQINSNPLDVFYILRVVTPGKFVVPAAFAEDMYRPEIQGVGDREANITVVSPKSLAPENS